ncbi:hypothetical protein QUA81_00820 [Microcoleus sp. F6_B4]
MTLNPAEKLTSHLDNMMLDDEFSRRLLELNSYNQSQVLSVDEKRH